MHIKIPTLSIIFDRYKKASLTRKGSIEIRITYNRKQKYISTGIFLYSNQWKNNYIVNSPDAVLLNKSLDTIIINIRKMILSMIEANNIDIFSIKNKLENIQSKQITFIEYCEKRTIIRKYGKSKDSQERYDRFIKHFIQYNKIKTFEDITEENIINYDKYLSIKNLKPYSKWNNYHRFLNSFILDAIDDGLLVRNPYKWINIEKDKNPYSLKKHLYPEEFKRFMQTQMPTESLQRIKDLFIVQTYLCLSYIDLKNFNRDNIQEIDNTKVYIGKRKKNSQTFTIPILKPALEIIEKYNYKLPIISNVKYNSYIKIAMLVAEIDKPVSTHWARHTGATLLLNEGVDITIVSKICGHSSIKITENTYARLLDRTIVNAISNIEDLI